MLTTLHDTIPRHTHCRVPHPTPHPGIGELEAAHPSGTLATIEVDVGQGKVKLSSKSEQSLVGKLQLGLYGQALLTELEDLATTDEAEESDRLCFPAAAIAKARASLGVRKE